MFFISLLVALWLALPRGVTSLKFLPSDCAQDNNYKYNRMLCPEVWNFKTPQSTFTTQKKNFNESKHVNTINSFIYNHLVSVTLPESIKVPESLTEVLRNDCDYYKLDKVKLSEFVTEDFIRNFVNSGNLYVLTVGTRLDCDNCASVTPDGHLILNLNKSTYQGSGLEGTVSHFHSVTKDRYIVTIDLKPKQFRPGKGNYERIKACLEKISHDVIITWEPPNENTCPSSVAKYFQDLGYCVSLCPTKLKSHVLNSVQLPKIEEDNQYEFVEWLGMVALQGNLIDVAPDNYVSTYETPECDHVTERVRFMQWRGFFTAAQIERFFGKLRESRKSRGWEWAAVYVQGFSDSPIAWRGEEHHFYTNGDNSYTFVLTDKDVITCIQKCSRKRYSNKRRGKPL